jgi:queuine tRNA-ribosyltransferase accessory subunit
MERNNPLAADADGCNDRLRGYHVQPSGPNEPRRNPHAYHRLNDVAEAFAEAESATATPDVDAEALQAMMNSAEET